MSKYEADIASAIVIFDQKINQNETHSFHSILEKAISSDISGSFSNFLFSFSDRKSLLGWFCSSSSLIYFSHSTEKGNTLWSVIICFWMMDFFSDYAAVCAFSITWFSIASAFFDWWYPVNDWYLLWNLW